MPPQSPAYTALAPILARLWTGQWPSQAVIVSFARAMRARGSPLAVLPRAIAATPEAAPQLEALLLQKLIAAGKLPAFAEHGPTAQAGNPLAYWQGPPVAFLHFEKTGGSALVGALARHFHPLQIAGDAAFTGGRRGAAQVAAADMRLRRRPLLWGHFQLADLRAGAPAHALLTVLREPKARILSLYYFWRSIRPELVPALEDPRVEAAQACALGDFLRLEDAGIRDAIDNVYIRRLTGAQLRADGTDPLRAEPDRCLAEALSALKNFAWIGLTHRVTQDYAALQARLGEDLGPPPQKQNAREHNPTQWPLLYRQIETKPLTASEEAALTPLTQYDSELFKQATKK